MRDLAKRLLEVAHQFGASPPRKIAPEVYPGAVILTRDMVGQCSPNEAVAMAIELIRAAQLAMEQQDGA